MDFITSKSASLPIDKHEMEMSHWFNMWSKQFFPYKELLEGDVLYWYDTPKKRLVWKTKVVEIERYPYDDKSQIFEKYHAHMTHEYYNSKSKSGYFLRYKVEVIERLNYLKPQYDFDRLGWERMDTENYKRWFNQEFIDDSTVLDDSIKVSLPLKDKLIELNRKMEFINPARVTKLIATTIRKDTNIVKAIKESTQYKCQFNDCGHQIIMKNGGFYIEVAHVEAVRNLGKSVLGNLVVLCPNHHKEFDYGDRIIHEQTLDKVSGLLNGKPFFISTKYTI